MGLNPCGLLSPAVYIGGEKTGIDLVDIGSGERRSLAVKRPTDQAARSRQAASPKLFLTLGWLFDAETLAWGESRLQAVLKSSNLLPIDLLIIDEIGPLEFERNQGWVSGLRLVDQRNYRLACITIRPALLLAARKRWPWGQVVQLNVNEKT
jgi:nucleoside-triphosphatase THEP1